MATLGELVVRFKADASQLERELKNVSAVTQQSTSRMSAALGGLRAQFSGLIPALSIAAVTAFAKNAVDAAGRMTDLAAQIGFASSTLSALEEGLNAAGANLDQFAAAVNLMNANIGAAASGNQQLAEKFAQLGISLDKLQALSPEEQFFQIVKALAGVEEQFRQTDIGRSIFGRGFSALLPIIKESNGELEQFVKTQQDFGKALSDEQLNRLDELGDSFGRVALTIRNDLLVAIDDAIQGFLRLFGLADDPGASQLEQKIRDLEAKLNTPESQRRRDRAGNVIETDAVIQEQIRRTQGLLDVQKTLEQSRASASGGSTPAKTGGGAPQGSSGSTSAANDLLKERERIIQQNRTAYEIMVEDSMKANQLFATDQEQRNRELQRAWTEYVSSIETGVEDAKDSIEDLSVSIRNSLANSFESALFDAKGFGDSLAQIFDGIARQIARKAFIDPLSSSISGLIGESVGSGGFLSGIGSLLGFADGGRPPIGRPSIVGERGPEIFVPDSGGTIIPNHALGGSSINVTNVFQVSAGVQGTVRAEIRSLLPSIVAASQSGTLAAIERGGRAAQIVGRKN